MDEHLKFCAECLEWYNPFIDPSWVTAHKCPSQHRADLQKQIDEIKELLK